MILSLLLLCINPSGGQAGPKWNFCTYPRRYRHLPRRANRSRLPDKGSKRFRSNHPSARRNRTFLSLPGKRFQRRICKLSHLPFKSAVSSPLSPGQRSQILLWNLFLGFVGILFSSSKETIVVFQLYLLPEDRSTRPRATDHNRFFGGPIFSANRANLLIIGGSGIADRNPQASASSL